MKKKTNLCMGCMSVKDYEGPCLKCGYDESRSYNPSYLAPTTFLADRYIIGKTLSVNGEGADYIAFDTAEEKRVVIREFMPDELCERKKDGEEIAVKEDCLPLYKSYLSEFADLYKTLMNSIDDCCIRKLYGIFAANNTGYAVMEYIEGMTLSDYLDKNGGKMSWEEAKAFFPPLFTALGMLHSKGIVHRGLSTDTIFVEKSGKPALAGVGISALRTADSRINCEMFTGYAACEQYALSERQGGWTDVYGISAVLYRVLTGKVPPEAREREQEDTIIEPSLLNKSIPQNVSTAIMKGLKVSQSERTHSIEKLVEQLYAEPTEEDIGGPVRPPVSEGIVRESREHREAPKRRPPQMKKSSKKAQKKKSSGIGTVIGFILFFALVTAFVIAIIYFSKETGNLNNPAVTTTEAPVTTAVTTTVKETTTTAETTKPPVTEDAKERLLMPDFFNRFYNSTLEARYSMLKFNPVYEYNDEVAKDIIFEQDIEAGVEVTAGTEVTVKISKGPENAVLPDYIGKKLSDYKKELDELGIKYETEAEETDEFKKNYVVRCSKEIGEKVNIAEEEVITVYYAVTPEKTEPAEDLFNPDADELEEPEEPYEE